MFFWCELHSYLKYKIRNLQVSLSLETTYFSCVCFERKGLKYFLELILIPKTLYMNFLFEVTFWTQWVSFDRLFRPVILTHRKPLPAEIIHQTIPIGSKKLPQIQISYMKSRFLLVYQTPHSNGAGPFSGRKSFRRVTLLQVVSISI